MHGTCRTHADPEKCTNLTSQNLNEGNNIARNIEYIVWEGGVDWIQLAQHRDKCQAVVNTVINLRVT
jgi:hypothetical protein